MAEGIRRADEIFENLLRLSKKKFGLSNKTLGFLKFFGGGTQIK